MKQQILKFNDHNYKVNIRDAADESVLAEIFKWREYRCAEPAILQAKLIIDVGAHAGFFSLYCRSLNPKAKIVSLEPEANNISALKMNNKANKLRLVMIESALAAGIGRRQLAISPDSHNHKLVLPGKKAPEGAIEVFGISPAALVNQLGIDSVDLLKLDIEGGEYEIFEAIKPETLGMIKNIIIEYHDDEPGHHKTIEAMLRSHGFSVAKFPSRFDKKLGFLFARNKKSHE